MHRLRVCRKRIIWPYIDNQNGCPHLSPLGSLVESDHKLEMTRVSDLDSPPAGAESGSIRPLALISGVTAANKWIE